MNVLESPDMFSGKSQKEKLFLASNSPRRKELMTVASWEYDILTPQVDETPLPGENGWDYVLRLAKSKVIAAASLVDSEGVIIAADTSVIDANAGEDGGILGKPCDHADAVRMLRALRGHSHQVLTAIAILPNRGSEILADLCATDVPMRDYTDEEVQAYVASGDPMDKAGAYAIQHPGFHPVEKLDGCFANVMGLPLCHLTRSLRRLGIEPNADVPRACQATLRYDCPVYAMILAGKN